MNKILGVLFLFFSAAAFAQPYPSKPIRVLVAFPPGGPVDIVARLVQPKLGDALGQPVVVENKVGASGNIATVEVARSAPDGYTLLTHSSAYAVNPALFRNAGYDPLKDLVPVAIVASQANIILVTASFPAATLDELRKQMLSGKLAFGSPGSGTTPHLTAQNLFHVRWKADVTHVPFKGARWCPGCSPASRRSAAWPAPGRWRTSSRAGCARSRCPRAGASRSFPTCRPSASSATRAWKTTPG